MKSSNQKVSVIMPSYNSSRTIARAIKSVVDQTYTNFELICIDDKSEDNSSEIVKSFSKRDPRISYIEFKENVGTAKSRDYGIKQSSGRYIAFLDSDDQWLSNHLEESLLTLKKQNTGFVYSNYFEHNEDGSIKKIINSPKELTFEDIKWHCPIGCLTVVLDKKKVFNMSPEFFLASRNDWAIWYEALKKTKGINTGKILSIRNVQKNSLTSSSLNTIWNTFIFQRKIVKRNIVMSAFSTLYHLYTSYKKKTVYIK